MNGRARLMPYPEERALEHAAYTLEVVPTRIYSVLLPVWCVEVRAEVTEGEPYELIDRFLERGIAEAELDTAESLASFFALDPSLVRRALRFLHAIGHVKESRGRIALTELGHRSVRDKVRYTHTRQDRRKLYFDAFACRPLTRAHYDVRKVTFLSGDCAQEALDRRDGPPLNVLSATRCFRREALFELAHSPDRDRYNLPERIDNPESLHEEYVFMPAYIVRAVAPGERVRHLVYTQAAAEADDGLTAACETTPEVFSAFEAEEVDAERQDFRIRAARWLSTRNLARYQPSRGEHGAWRVTIPGTGFGTGGGLPLTRLGSFVVLGTSFFHVWCADERVRRRALLERIDSYLGARARTDRDTVEAQIARISHQLGLGILGIDDLRRAAAGAGRRALADQLARLR
ncbi:hypothetical protein [Streptomyces sp. NPDC058572]|uniref:hypothetical protein n=1 Tax=Streptomyces sp. NPDC058572 TaxID=3346546 RepID=UPI003650A93D